jgi:hypothetical protein
LQHGILLNIERGEKMNAKTRKVVHVTRYASLLSILLFLLTLGGCSLMPNYVVGPTISVATTEDTNAGLHGDYKINKTDSASFIEGKSGFAPGVLPYETTQTGIRSKLEALIGAYSARHDHLTSEVDGYSNSQFLGVILAGIGVGTKSIPTRNTGLGISGLSTFIPSHFEVAVQALNYQTATDAMKCIYDSVTPIPPAFWDAAYDKDGTFLFTKDQFNDGNPGAAAPPASAAAAATPAAPTPGAGGTTSSTKAEVAASYTALATMYQTLNQSIRQVDDKLRAKQASVAINAVSLSDIQNAAKGQAAAKTASDAATPAIAAAASANSTTTTKALAAKRQETLNKQENVQSLLKDRDENKQKFDTANRSLQAVQADFIQFQNTKPGLKVEMLSPHVSRPATISATDLKMLAQKRDAVAAATASRNQAEEIAKQADADLTRAQGEKAVADAELEAAHEASAKAKAFANMVALGQIDAAIQLPATVQSCVAIMGK